MDTVKNIMDFVFGNDLDFYEKNFSDLSLEAQAALMKECPEFLNEEPISIERLEQDSIYQNVMEEIKKNATL